MRIQYSQQVTRLLRVPANGDLRDMLRSLLADPRPGWAQPIPERPGYYEFNAAGHWITYRVDETGGETVITVTLTE